MLHIKLKNISCESNPSYINDMKCEILPTGDGSGNLTIITKLKFPLEDVWLRLAVFYQKQNTFRKSMIDYDGDICSFLSGKEYKVYVHSHFQ